MTAVRGPVLGALLCGGASRRMGTDKALIAVAGEPLVVRVADMLRAGGCDPVVAIGGDGVRLSEAGLQVVADRRPGEGPLDGIIRALEVADGCPALVVACDMPSLDPATVQALVGSLVASAGSVDVVVARSARLEPLCAVWAPSALPVLEAAFERGERAVHRAVDLVRLGEVQVSPDVVRNVNTPAELDEAVRALGAHGSATNR